MPISCCPEDTGSQRSFDECLRSESTWSCVFPDALRPSFPQEIPKPVPSVFCRNRPVVTSSIAVPTLTQRAGHLERNRGASRVPAMPVRPGPGPDTQNVSKLTYVFPQASSAGMPAAALRQGAKISARDFPERVMRPALPATAGFRSRSKCPNVSKQKHEIRICSFLIPENPVFTRRLEKSKPRLSAGGLHHAIFSSTMNSPDSAI